MSPRPHEGTAEEGLSSSLLEIVHDPARLERLRKILSGFCHRCRNSLNGIKMGLYLFRREARGDVPQCWGDLEAIYHDLERLFDHLQTIYRPMSVTMVRCPLDELIGDHVPKWRSWFESGGRGLQVEPPDSEVRGDFDPIQLGVGLDALASWRAEAGEAGALARIGWGVREGCVEIRWEELRPRRGSEPPELAAADNRREAGTSARRVDALALPLLARIVAAHGGQLRCESRPGFVIRLRWPQFQQASRGDVA